MRPANIVHVSNFRPVKRVRDVVKIFHAINAELPARLVLVGDGHIVLPLAWEEGVDFAPGNIFFPDQSDGKDRLRLNFVAQAPEQINAGIKRLGSAIRRLLTAK